MTSDEFIQQNQTSTLRKGDKVVMHNCGEAEYYKDTTWTCITPSFKNRSMDEVVFLKGYSGSFLTKYLRKHI